MRHIIREFGRNVDCSYIYLFIFFFFFVKWKNFYVKFYNVKTFDIDILGLNVFCFKEIGSGKAIDIIFNSFKITNMWYWKKVSYHNKK